MPRVRAPGDTACALAGRSDLRWMGALHERQRGGRRCMSVLAVLAEARRRRLTPNCRSARGCPLARSALTGRSALPRRIEILDRMEGIADGHRAPFAFDVIDTRLLEPRVDVPEVQPTIRVRGSAV